MYVKTYGSAVYGVMAVTITIEVNIDRGMKFYLVGLPDNAVKESHQRISSALQNNGYRIPGKQITVNMAPADIRKEGSAYDLPIAMGILSASGQMKTVLDVGKYLIMGELSLDGKIRSIRGVLPMVIQAKKEQFKGVIVPEDNLQEASVVDGIKAYGASHINQVIDFFNGEINSIKQHTNSFSKMLEETIYDNDFKYIKGQQNVKRAMEIAASGGHNILLIGPPGSGKSMISKSLSSILPPLTLEESIETTKIHSVAGRLNSKFGLITKRPFRSPHHTISDVALVGGGSNPRPGEISLAHNGVLFLDELPEFKRTVIEVLRQPLEDRHVTISRSKISVDYPANFMLVAAMNPSPSGDFIDPNDPQYGPQVKRYLSKISGPLLDRIDLHIEVQPVAYDKLSNDTLNVESSQKVRSRVIQARNIQTKRYREEQNIHCNAQISPKATMMFCKIDEQSKKILKVAMEKLSLSARSYHRILKLARTIADLEQSQDIKTNHIAEAIQYRSLDRQWWK